MARLIINPNNQTFFFNCIKTLKYETFIEEEQNLNYQCNKSENLTFNGFEIKSFGRTIAFKHEEDNIIIVKSYDHLIENTKLELNKYTNKHINHLIIILDYINVEFGILQSKKEIEEYYRTEHNVEIIKEKWLSKYVKCSIENIKETCSIDLDEYNKIVKTECGHYFSIENLYEWIRNNEKNSCPLCRTILL
jgi:hypothetical protein